MAENMEDNLEENNYDILLINPNYHRRLDSGIIPPLGLAYLVSFLHKGGFFPKILDCSLYFDSLDATTIKKMKYWLIEQLTPARPKLAIGIGPCTTSAIRSIIAIADTCKQIYPNIPIIYGGPLTLIPDQEWLFFGRLNAFAIVKGDGEYALSSILYKLRLGESISGIPGVQTSEDMQVRPEFIQNLDTLPFPSWNASEICSYKPSVRRDLFVYPFAPIIGSRGCPHSCKFCISGQLIKYRRHSFDYIIEQVKLLQETYHIRSIIFYDDNLFPSAINVNEELKSFVDLFKNIKPDLLWQIEVRPDVFSHISIDMFEKIFSCGCRQINIGIEKAQPSELFSKSFDIDQLIESTCLAPT
jgi:anaerobic magnesium-protoporphyrin IX monomethyl ester cyclase